MLHDRYLYCTFSYFKAGWHQDNFILELVKMVEVLGLVGQFTENNQKIRFQTNM